MITFSTGGINTFLTPIDSGGDKKKREITRGSKALK